MRLENRVALITGAGRGIGQAIALAYAKEGARLALAARTLSELEETAQQAEELGAEALVIPTDVSDQSQVDKMVRRTLDRYSAIDILVNNAAVVGPIGPLQDNDVSSWIRAIQVNLIGTYFCCRAVLSVMLQQDRGKIINMSGTTGGGAPLVSAYGSSKTAIVSLTESLSLELIGKNIQVNVMTPAAPTQMIEELLAGYAAVGATDRVERLHHLLNTIVSMEQTTELAVFLASDASGSLSGRLILAWDEDISNLPPRIPEIMASDAYTLRRVEPG